MKQQEILEMQVGSLCDQAVADQVLGKIVLHEVYDWMPPVSVLTQEAWKAYMIDVKHQMGPRPLMKYLCKHYSTDLKDATEVITRMLSLGYRYESKVLPDGRHAWKFEKEGQSSPFVACATMEEAICKAALLAI